MAKTPEETAKELLDEAVRRIREMDPENVQAVAGYAMLVPFTPAQLADAYNLTVQNARRDSDKVNTMVTDLLTRLAGEAQGNILTAMAMTLAMSLESADEVPMIAAVMQRLMVDGFWNNPANTRPPDSRLN